MSSRPTLRTLPSRSLVPMTPPPSPIPTSPLSTTSFSSSPSPSPLSKRPPQLVPYAPSPPSFEHTTLTIEEEEIVRTTSFPPADVSAQDFDFDELFVYDRPGPPWVELRSVVEVCVPRSGVKSGMAGRTASGVFSFSHYGKGRENSGRELGVVRRIGGIGGFYVRKEKGKEVRR